MSPVPVTVIGGHLGSGKTADRAWSVDESGRLVLIALAGTAGLEHPDRLVHALFA